MSRLLSQTRLYIISNRDPTEEDDQAVDASQVLAFMSAFGKNTPN